MSFETMLILISISIHTIMILHYLRTSKKKRKPDPNNNQKAQSEDSVNPPRES